MNDGSQRCPELSNTAWLKDPDAVEHVLATGALPTTTFKAGIQQAQERIAAYTRLSGIEDRRAKRRRLKQERRARKRARR